MRRFVRWLRNLLFATAAEDEYMSWADERLDALARVYGPDRGRCPTCGRKRD